VRLLSGDPVPATSPAPADAGRARSVAMAVAARLADRDRLADAVTSTAATTAYPESTRWRPSTVALGDAGLALCCAELHAHNPDAGWDRVGHRFLGTAVAGLTDDAPLGLFGGLSGVAAAAGQLGGAQRYRRLRAQLDDRLLPALRPAAERIDSTDGALPAAAYDVISGLAGCAAGLLARPADPGVRAALVEVAGVLVRLLDGDGLPRLATPPEHVLAEQRAEAPDGWTDCGVAHGVPGLVATLALLALDRRVGPAVTELPGLLPALRRGAAWVVGQAVTVDGRTEWPRVVLPGAGAGRPAPPGWCYGTPGVARALWLAGRALDEPGHQRLAVDAMLAACRSDALPRSPALCHGLAGLLTITRLFWLDTGEPAFGRAAGRVLTELLDRYDPDLPLGYRDVEPAGSLVDNPGLLSGAAGIVLALLAATRPDVPAWARLFLLA